MSLLNYKNPNNLSSGNYLVTLESFTEIEPIYEQNSDTILFKPYIQLTLKITRPDNSIQFIVDKLYENRIPYFVNCINKQFAGKFADNTLSQILTEIMLTTKFQININYDTKYGRQINYFPIL